MIKLIRNYNDKHVETTDVDEADFPPYVDYSDIFDKMEAEQCHTIIVQLESGRQVLFTISEGSTV